MDSMRGGVSQSPVLQTSESSNSSRQQGQRNFLTALGVKPSDQRAAAIRCSSTSPDNAARARTSAGMD